MLEPRKADVPALFLVLVVLPIFLYILLGKWGETAKSKGRINLIVEAAFEESFEVNPMTTASVIPLVMAPPISPIRECARCGCPATTRCSRCKSIRYCSGKCQITHWRQGHKDECQPPDYVESSSGRTLMEDSGPKRDFAHGQYSKRGTGEVGVDLECSVLAREVSSHIEEVSTKNNLSQYSSDGYNSYKCSADLDNVRLPKSTTKVGRVQVHPTKLRKGSGSNEPDVGMGTSTSVHESDDAASVGLMKRIGLRKMSKISKQDVDLSTHSLKKVKVLFPFEEFVRFFDGEVFDLAPRGLQNCGNSCYANAVLQCLTCTKPLVAYLLSRKHSRACCRKNWCLICELEKHVMLLKEAGGPLSPSRILSHMRGINCQIGDGSQEDAHEFLRLLLASMQSISLEEVGGEKQVHPISQETTFVQQTFGGRLRSKVLCLKCHHESERYENIMDLTLEIYGWVESLEDALTQFTAPEDLDGENMYRCGRCAAYVRARKKLSIDEAPNILTIVLKRFQEGNYGKINKCITFPEMLDMVPFMTATNDVPPLYMLYGVVVHVDTLNASFSGHYVSYVKDLQGNWFRIDDSVVQPVPTSQVMSEGAYILFYKRSFPRPPRTYTSKATKKQFVKASSKPCGQNVHRANRVTQPAEIYAEPNFMQFSDDTSSDWSHFTSSDDASFTSESTRDSFSTIEYSDMCRFDPVASGFSSRAAQDRPSQRTVSCRMFSGSKPVTRYISEQIGFIIDSDMGGNTGQVSVSFNDDYLPDNGYQNFVNYGSSSPDRIFQNFGNLHL